MDWLWAIAIIIVLIIGALHPLFGAIAGGIVGFFMGQAFGTNTLDTVWWCIGGIIIGAASRIILEVIDL